MVHDGDETLKKERKDAGFAVLKLLGFKSLKGLWLEGSQVMG